MPHLRNGQQVSGQRTTLCKVFCQGLSRNVASLLVERLLHCVGLGNQLARLLESRQSFGVALCRQVALQHPFDFVGRLLCCLAHAFVARAVRLVRHLA